MYLRFLVLLVTSFFIMPVFAQFKPYEVKEGHKKWEDGKLTWNDFQGIPLGIAPAGSEFIYHLFYYPEKIKTSDTTYFKLKAFAFMNRKESWAHDSVKTDLYLNYNQAIFNLLELHRRELEPRFLSIANEQEALTALNDQQRLFREEIAKLIVETRNGRDLINVNTWLNRSYKKLDSVQEKSRMPRFQARNYGFSSHMGYAQSYLSGESGNAFGSFSGLDFGSNFQYKKLTLLLNTNFESGKTSAADGIHNWSPGLPISLFHLNFAIGYPVLNTSHWRILPFAGPARVIILTNTEEEIYKDQGIADNTMVYGLQIDWKIRSRISLLLPRKTDNVVSDYGIRTRLIISPVDYSSQLNGTVFNFSISLFLNTQYIKILPNNN